MIVQVKIKRPDFIFAPDITLTVGSACLTNQKENGTCKLAEDCDWFKDAIFKNPLNRDAAHCDFEANDPVVCCKDR